MRHSIPIIFVGVLCSSTALGLEIASSSFIGQTGDRVVATEIQSDGSIIVAANITGGPLASPSMPPGTVMRLSSDGSQILARTSVGEQVHDLSIDEVGNVFVASTDGVTKLDQEVQHVVWRKDLGRVVNRIDVGHDGHCAVLCYDHCRTYSCSKPHSPERGFFEFLHCLATVGTVLKWEKE